MKDNIIKDTVFCIFIFILILILLVALTTVIKPTLSENNTVFVTHCGFSKDYSFKSFEGDFIQNRLFSNPYDTIEIKVDDYFLLKERNRPKLIIDAKKGIEESYRQYYTKIIFDGNQSTYYSDILKNFQKIKSIYNLDDDEYLQLIVNFVQSMPYYTAGSDVKYPIVTYTDGCGDCDDKSLLLVALLSQENYNVSVFIIPPDGSTRISHAMAGVASKSATFTKNGYAMIETTKKDSAIGEFPSSVASEKVLIIKIGNGTKTFEISSSIWIIDDLQYRVVKKGDRTVSITSYHQDGFLGFISEKKENRNWQKDCEDGRIPSVICNASFN